VDAYGEDSADWVNHVPIAETEKVRVAGKAVTAVYLVPEGYERVDDENGYTVIVKKGTKVDAQRSCRALTTTSNSSEFGSSQQ